jgi:riboflavin biosynthesis pyrimidine reductase
VDPLRPLYEVPAAAALLPPPLQELYGGGLRLAQDLVYANFVTSLDGVVALPAPTPSGALLSGRNPADRFVMGLLRALADAILVGAGTLRAEPRHLWTPTYASREHAAAFATLGRPEPRLVVVTVRGDLDPECRALQAGALVLTTDGGAARLRNRLPSASQVRSLGAEPPGGAAILAAIREEGHRRVLSEGGPTLMAALVADRQLDELFLTLSPILAGRRAGDGRLGLLEGIELLPGTSLWAHLLSLRVHGTHLFLRYSLK